MAFLYVFAKAYFALENIVSGPWDDHGFFILVKKSANKEGGHIE